MTDKEFNDAMAKYFETHGIERTLKALVNQMCIICQAGVVEFEAQGHGYTVEVREGD